MRVLIIDTKMYVVFNIHGEIWSLGGGRNNTLQGEANGPTPFPPLVPTFGGGRNVHLVPTFGGGGISFVESGGRNFRSIFYLG